MAQSQLLLLSINLLLVFISFFSSSEAAGIAIYVNANALTPDEPVVNEGLFVYVFSPLANITGEVRAGYDDDDDDRIVFASVDRSINSPAASTSSSSPQQVSDDLWNNLLGGADHAVVNGINFEIDDAAAGSGSGSGQFLVDVARSLRARSTTTSLQSESQSMQKTQVYLSATVSCLFPTDPYVGSALESGVFDYIWVRFFNNRRCEFGADAVALLAAWNRWTRHLNSSSPTRIFLGLPGAPGAALTGYIPPQLLTSLVLPLVRTSPNYGGVMLFSDTFYDQQKAYIQAIKNSV